MKKANIDYNYCKKELPEKLEELSICPLLEEITLTKFIVSMINEEDALNFFMDFRQKLGPIKLILQCFDHGELIRTFKLLQDYEMRLDQILEVTRPLTLDEYVHSTISVNNWLLLAKNNSLTTLERNGVNDSNIQINWVYIEFEMRKVTIQGDFIIFLDAEITRLVANKFESDDKIILPKDSGTKIINQSEITHVAVVITKESLYTTPVWEKIKENLIAGFSPQANVDLNYEFKFEIK